MIFWQQVRHQNNVSRDTQFKWHTIHWWSLSKTVSEDTLICTRDTKLESPWRSTHLHFTLLCFAALLLDQRPSSHPRALAGLVRGTELDWLAAIIWGCLDPFVNCLVTFALDWLKSPNVYERSLVGLANLWLNRRIF